MKDVVDLAARLEVDVVLMCNFVVNAGRDKLTCYAIDVHSQETYVREVTTDGFLEFKQGSEAVEKVIRGALDGFLEARPA